MNNIYKDIEFLTDNKNSLTELKSLLPDSPFSQESIDFLDNLSKEIFKIKIQKIS